MRKIVIMYVLALQSPLSLHRLGNSGTSQSIRNLGRGREMCSNVRYQWNEEQKLHWSRMSNRITGPRSMSRMIADKLKTAKEKK